MLNHLSISNYVLIRELDMDFPSGLNIITGETGAGKSIMLGALSLLLGHKADSSVFSDNTRNCVIEGEFDLDGEQLILRRVITPAGRSRAFLNDEPVSVSELANLSDRLVDIHEQHHTRLLSNTDYQLSILDGYAGNDSLLSEYGELWNSLQEKRKELISLRESMAAASKDRDYRQFQFDQLYAASLRDGELEEIEAEQKMLSNAEMIKAELTHASVALENEEYTVARSLKDSVSSLSKLARYIPEAEELAGRLSESRIEIEDVLAEVNSLNEKVNVSPQRLSEVEERMDVLYTLMKKHNVTSVEELISIREDLEESLSREESDGEKLKELEAVIASLEEEIDIKGDELSRRRKLSAESFKEELQSSIRELEMPQAVLEVVLTSREKPCASGKDEIHFLFSANGGRTPGELSKVASGGELSRVMLSLKKVISGYTTLPTMIFDEIDTGVSGRMADRMGRMIARMGEKMQIFAITHLPQIASQSGAHFLIEKRNSTYGSQTSIRRLSGDERVTEVARMLSGDSLTEAAIENAKTLLKENT